MSDENNASAGAPGDSTQKFSIEYVKELRQENAGYRVRAQAAESKLADAEKAAAAVKEAQDKAQAAADERIKAAEEKALARIIKAELKAHAIKAGIVDLDGLQLADLSAIKTDEHGEVQGAEGAIDALRKAKPYLFTTTTGSAGRAGAGQPPATGDEKPKRATDMTTSEYAAFKRARGMR